MNDVSIVITGDFCVNELFEREFINDDSFQFFGETLNFYKKKDFVITNLEYPLTNCNAKIDKTGPTLKGNPLIINRLKSAGFNLATLANNHILDYGEQGLADTLKICQKNNINFVGAGLNLKEAQQPFYFEKEGLRIAILNFAENEWSIASQSTAGANPLNVIDNVHVIREVKDKVDVVIVIIHGGHEYYHLPSPRIVKQYRFYAENGASVIVGHHPHCISGYEMYNNVPIFYSLGNFLFTMKSKYEAWYTGLILQLSIGNKNKIKWELIPIRQNKESYNLTLLKNDDKRAVLNDVDKYSQIISNEQALTEHWNRFLIEKQKEYITVFSPLNAFENKYIKAGIRRMGLERFLLKKKQYKQILNLIRCEAHLDASIGIVNNYFKK